MLFGMRSFHSIGAAAIAIATQALQEAGAFTFTTLLRGVPLGTEQAA